MNFKKIEFQLVLLSLMLLFNGCSSFQANQANQANNDEKTIDQPVQIPEDWIENAAGDIFTFFAPAGVVEVDVMGIDSFVTRYESDSIGVSTDYGFAPAKAVCGDEYVECEAYKTTISGKNADIIVAKVKDENDQEIYVARLYVPRVVLIKEAELEVFEIADHLGMSARSTDETLRDDLLRIVQSVTFTEEFLRSDDPNNVDFSGRFIEENLSPGPNDADLKQPRVTLFQPVRVPSDWVEMKAGNVFTFYAPVGVKEVDVQGIDSFVAQFESDLIEISSDYGWHSAKPVCGDEYVECEAYKTTISGKEADIIVAKTKGENDQEKYVARLYVPRVVLIEEAEIEMFEIAKRLVMSAKSTDETLRDDLLRIVQSVTFTEEILSESN